VRSGDELAAVKLFQFEWYLRMNSIGLNQLPEGGTDRHQVRYLQMP